MLVTGYNSAGLVINMYLWWHGNREILEQKNDSRNYILNT